MTEPRRSTDTDEYGHPIYKTLNDTEFKIEQSIPAITTEIKVVYSLIKERRIWQPPESVKPEISQFYRGLKLPIFNGRLSLLLHGLDATPTPTPPSPRPFHTQAPQLRGMFSVTVISYIYPTSGSFVTSL